MCEQHQYRRISALSLAALAISLLLTGSSPERRTRILIDGSSPGRIFQGIGALSAGASSRLLIDYPEPQRGEILDFLFNPNFGASLHHLKVEIGGDINSTDGTEPSHARSREELLSPRKEYYERGYEWWLMREAKKRNPNIVLDVLQWGAPSWIGGLDPGADRPGRVRFFSQDNADFIVRFTKGAREYHGLDIDYCGIWNETPYDAKWIKLLRRTLDAAGLHRVKIVAADQTPDVAPAWKIAEDILADKELSDAIHTIGAHYSSSTAWKHALKEPFASTPEAKQTGKPLWASEDGPWRGDWEGARALARIFNRNYIVGKMTKTITWSLVTSYLDNLPIPGSGPMKANSPWSGHYEVQPALWAIAHTTQFVQPGWRYLDASCGFTSESLSYVTLRSAITDDWSMILETIDAKEPIQLEVNVATNLSLPPVQVWRTNEQHSFEHLPSLNPQNGTIQLTLDPNSIYSLTTTTGQRKGISPIAVPQQQEFPSMYLAGFENSALGATPKYFCDLFGAFEVSNRPDGKGNALKQVIRAPGIEWPIVPHKTPRTIIGSKTWKDCEVTSDVWTTEGTVSIVARFDKPWESGYWFTLDSKGGWKLSAHDSILAAGKLQAFTIPKWKTLSLRCYGQAITASCDGVLLASIHDTTYRSGFAGFGTGWNTAWFDNIQIRSNSSLK